MIMLDAGSRQPRDATSGRTAQPGAATAEPDSRVEVLGCPIDALDMPATVERCLELIDSGHGARQVSINAAKLTSFYDDEAMASFIRECDLISADGQAVVWASRLFGRPLPGRVPGIDLMLELLAAANERGLRVYILGARDTVLTKAVELIRSEYPNVRLVGAQHGYFGPDEEAGIAGSIRAAKPDLLFVAMDSPRKEQWLGANAERLGVRFSMGVGGSIDILAGKRRRAPGWVQRLGLEWLWRFAQDPRRMWRRYTVGNLRFVWLVMREKMRLSGARSHG